MFGSSSELPSYFTQCSWQMKIPRETHEYCVCSNWCSAVALSCRATSHSVRDCNSCASSFGSLPPCSSCASAAQSYFTQCSWQMKRRLWANCNALQHTVKRRHSVSEPTATHCNTLWNTITLHQTLSLCCGKRTNIVCALVRVLLFRCDMPLGMSHRTPNFNRY